MAGNNQGIEREIVKKVAKDCQRDSKVWSKKSRSTIKKTVRCSQKDSKR